MGAKVACGAASSPRKRIRSIVRLLSDGGIAELIDGDDTISGGNSIRFMVSR
jgi:hypothetical protein